jgi:hypothetical protein
MYVLSLHLAQNARPAIRLMEDRHYRQRLNLELVWVGIRIFFAWSLACLAIVVPFFVLAKTTDLLTNLPGVIQIALGLLLVLTGILAAAMLRERHSVLQAHRQFLRIFDSIKSITAQERVNGLPPEKMAEIRRRGTVLRGPLKDWWMALDGSVDLYIAPDGRQGWFLTRPAKEIFTEDDLVFNLYHASFYQAVPSVLTAVGLLATFVAILQGLAGVTYNEADALHPVGGIDALINGLAGKFLSSIVALILSVLFTFLERKVCERQISRSYEQLLRRSKEVFPFLSPSRILLDVQRLLSSQHQNARDVAGASL